MAVLSEGANRGEIMGQVGVEEGEKKTSGVRAGGPDWPLEGYRDNPCPGCPVACRTTPGQEATWRVVNRANLATMDPRHQPGNV